MREERAWAAGFFDGEGCCLYIRSVLSSGTAQRSISVQVSQSVSPELLERFARAVEVGKVHGPYRTKNPNAQPYWTYRIGGIEGVRRVADRLWPWLGATKRAQFEGAMSEWNDFVPDFKPCPHGSTYTVCGPCHSTSAEKAWITRRAA